MEKAKIKEIYDKLKSAAPSSFNTGITLKDFDNLVGLMESAGYKIHDLPMSKPTVSVCEIAARKIAMIKTKERKAAENQMVFRDCLSHFICPRCGSLLAHKSSFSSPSSGYMRTEYHCISCDFDHTEF